jgi:hypothetical protein
MPRKALPVITESAEALLALRRLERDERRRERLHALWLLATGAAPSRLVLAEGLGRNRGTIGGWLSLYAAGGLAALLAPAKAPGPPSQGGLVLAPTVRAAIAERLARPEGERGYRALWLWARAEHDVTLSYSHFHRWVRCGLGARLKVARKSHGQKKRTNSWPASSAACAPTSKA